MRNLIYLVLAAFALALAACGISDHRPQQQAECSALGGTYRADPARWSEDECSVTTTTGKVHVIEYDEVHVPEGVRTVDD